MPIPSEPSTTVEYRCGDCGRIVEMKPQEAIRCKECGYHIIYKTRTKRCIQYEAN